MMTMMVAALARVACVSEALARMPLVTSQTEDMVLTCVLAGWWVSSGEACFRLGPWLVWLLTLSCKHSPSVLVPLSRLHVGVVGPHYATLGCAMGHHPLPTRGDSGFGAGVLCLACLPLLQGCSVLHHPWVVTGKCASPSCHVLPGRPGTLAGTLQLSGHTEVCSSCLSHISVRQGTRWAWGSARWVLKAGWGVNGRVQ